MTTDAEAADTYEEPEQLWGFPGAGILSLVLMAATILISVVSIHLSLVSDARRDATDKCIAYYLGE